MQYTQEESGLNDATMKRTGVGTAYVLYNVRHGKASNQLISFSDEKKFRQNHKPHRENGN